MNGGEGEFVQDFDGKTRRKEITRKTWWGDNIEIDLREIEWGVWTGSIWLRIETSGWLL
jgi:hypothetical protein